METAPSTTSLPPPPRAAELVNSLEDKRLYWDRSFYDSPASQMAALQRSSTLYIGNLSFQTRSRHIYSHFSQLGDVVAVHMGLDRLKKTPCGFCFVEYRHRASALAAVKDLSGTKLAGSVIRVELDAGFQPGRQYGRGVSGGQVRHDRKREQRPPPPPVASPSGPRDAEGGEAYYGPNDGDEERQAKRQRME